MSIIKAIYRRVFFPAFGARIGKVFFSALLISLALLTFAPAETDVLQVPITPSSNGIDGWKVQEWRGKADFEVVKTEFGNAVHLKSSSTSTALYREIKFEIKDYPVLHWRWKVTELPKGGDVRNKSTDDQAAQVYVVFPKWPAPVNSRVIGYIWDTTVPQGLPVQSTKSTRTKYMVIRSGSGGLGEWFSEKRNVLEDYKRLFKEEPPKVGSVSIMIDSDDTDSSAESFVGDIYFSK